MVLFFLLLILSIFIIFVTTAFSYTFVRHQKKGINDISSPVNKFLNIQKEMANSGIFFIENAPHERVYIKSHDNLKLSARFYPNTNARGTIILFHGYRASSSREFCCTIKMYYEAGLNVLLVDQRSHGESEGRLITFGIKESVDAVSWVQYVCQRCGKQSPIFLGGLSMGATTVMTATGRNLPKNVCGIIADCGFTSAHEIISLVAKKRFHFSPTFLIRLFDIICRVFGKFSIYEYDTTDILNSNKIPIFFIHGKADSFVPCYMSERNFKANLGEKQITLIDEARHGHSFLIAPERLTKEIQNFISAHIPNNI